MDEATYIPVEDVATILGVKTRQAHRYGDGPNPRIRTKMVNHRKLFHKGDTEALAGERKAAKPHSAQRPKTDLVPVGEMLEYIRERDRQVEELHRQLTEAAAQVGYLRGQLEQRLLPEAAAALHQQVEALKMERDALQAQLKAKRQPWWKRFFS